MTRFTVVWAKGAEEELIEIWLSAPDRRAVSAAANAIDSRLRKDAALSGSELNEGLLALYEGPLKILFAVREDDRIVEVLRVRLA